MSMEPTPRTQSIHSHPKPQSTNIPAPFVFLCKRACYALSIALFLRVITYMVTVRTLRARWG